MKLKDIEVDFDFLDADNVEKFEIEAQKVTEKCNNVEVKEMSYSDAIRQECNIIEDFLNNVFEKGISEKLFGGKKNLAEHIKLFQELVDMKNEQQEELQSLYDRYTPHREQRRNYKKGRR